jgi:hypothetical protein
MGAERSVSLDEPADRLLVAAAERSASQPQTRWRSLHAGEDSVVLLSVALPQRAD